MHFLFIFFIRRCFTYYYTQVCTFTYSFVVQNYRVVGQPPYKMNMRPHVSPCSSDLAPAIILDWVVHQQVELNELFILALIYPKYIKTWTYFLFKKERQPKCAIFPNWTYARHSLTKKLLSVNRTIS